jgi:nucleotide-binding universal stress UspA family protein
MLKRILVPLDGSERARQALPVAARIARDSGGSLLLFSVLQPSVTPGWQIETSLMQAESREAERQERQKELAWLAGSEELRGLEVKTEVVEDLPAQAILEKARLSAADLIVLCSHGRTGITRWALGSVAQKVARHSPIPVFILRAGWPMPLPPHGMRPIRVLVALDGSPLAESSLLPAAQLSSALSSPLPGELHLVRVIPFSSDFEYGQDDAVAAARKQAIQEIQTYFQGVRQQLTEQVRVQVTTSIATSLDTAETLIGIAETGEGEGLPRIVENADVIALATHGRTGPARWVMGSITERILGATRLPLLVVRPQHVGKVVAREEKEEQASLSGSGAHE